MSSNKFALASLYVDFNSLFLPISIRSRIGLYKVDSVSDGLSAISQRNIK